MTPLNNLILQVIPQCKSLGKELNKNIFYILFTKITLRRNRALKRDLNWNLVIATKFME